VSWNVVYGTPSGAVDTPRQPSAAALLLAGYAPSVLRGTVLQPSAGALALSGKTPTLSSTFTTSFPATENPLSQSGTFRTGLAHGLDWTDPQTTGGTGAYGTQSVHTPPPYDDSMAVLDPAKYNFGVRHWAQGTIFTNSNSGAIEAELFLAGKIDAHSITGYEIDLVSADSAFVIVRWDGALNDFTVISGGEIFAGTYTAGAVWYAQIDENGVITVKCNGTTVGTATDTTYANQSGRNPGMGFYRDTSRGAVSASNTYGFSSWSAGSF
jgi:hypothetical protein